MSTSLKYKLNKDRPLNNGRYPLVLQIIHKRQRRLIYTGFHIYEESFNEQKQRIVTSHKDHFKKGEVGRMNDYLALIRKNVSSLIDYLNFSTETFTAHDIVSLYQRKQNNRYVITFAENQIETKLSMDRYGTAKNYRYTISALRQFVKNDTLTFTDIDLRFLRGYEMFLEKKKLKANSIAFYIHNLRTIYNKALEEDIFELPQGGSPFDKLKVKKVKTIKRALPTDVIRRVAELDLSSTPDLDFSRDLFMFSFYTRGMPFVDIVNLKHENIEGRIIHYFRAKTKTLIKVGITDQLQHIIDKYRTDSMYVIPCLRESNTVRENYAKYRTTLAWHNKCLKDIARMIGLDTPLTTYVARHSWATAAKAKGVPIAVISEGLGHSTENITNVYLKEFDQDILDAANEDVTLL